MPPRSNEFQRLVKLIYEQIKPEGASVRESAMLRERGSVVEREVDVLVETTIADVTIRLAVECRDRSRADDIEWIDQLIGKYRDLPVDKVIAVSAAGVTKAASEKAGANKIEVRTLREALDADWPKELKKSQFANLNINVKPTSYCVFTEPEWPDKTPPVRVSFHGNDLIKADFESFLTQTGHREIARILETKTDHPLRRIENLNQGYEIEFELAVADPVTLMSIYGTEHRLVHMTLRCKVDFRYEDVPVARHLFGNVGVTIAEYPATRVVKVQAPGKEPTEATVPLDADEE